jgi:hypothetical protein
MLPQGIEPDSCQTLTILTILTELSRIDIFLKDLGTQCVLYTNICTNKYCKCILKLLRLVSVLIHHLQGVTVVLANVMNY